LNVAEMAALIENYLYDCELRLQSPRTLETRRVFLKNFLWFLNHREYETCGVVEIRQFLRYLMHGHEEPDGRFGNPNLKRAVRPVTVLDYYVCLRSLFDWIVTQRLIQETPFALVTKPQAREESKAPLSPEQLAALFRAAERSADPLRNRAILALLLDTGCRASEFATMRVRDLDLANGRCRVLGKGDKYRMLFFGQRTAGILAEYFQQVEEKRKTDSNQTNHQIDLDSPLFASVRGREPLTRSGLLHLIKRLGKRAGIKDEVSVHALRRSFAVQMLKNGANVFSVQAMLGHSTLQQTRKYCALALADSEAQHRQFSPMDRFAQAQPR
jgi:integrase/recombinase XerD